MTKTKYTYYYNDDYVATTSEKEFYAIVVNDDYVIASACRKEFLEQRLQNEKLNRAEHIKYNETYFLKNNHRNACEYALNKISQATERLRKELETIRIVALEQRS